MPQPTPAISFAEIGGPAGITFTHHNGAAGDYWYPELFGGGVAVLDIDTDGWPDLLFVDGSAFAPAALRRDKPAPPSASGRSRHGLYRNNRDGTFTDVLEGSGLDSANVYGLGASVADYDNDGRDDVFITTVDGGRLFHNERNGKFADVTGRSGVRNREFSVSSAWFDYNRDGLLDLFIGNYVKWSAESEMKCAQNGVRGYCGPDAYKPVAPKLFRNLGGGRFQDATASAGLDDPTDKAMGVAVLDYNADGWLDVFIGSDRVPAKLYRNRGRGPGVIDDGGARFVDEAVAAGVALSEYGRARANMGVDAADFDRSGRPDLVVGNFTNEMLGLYRNEDGRTFVDVAPRSEVGRASLLFVTWGVFFLDYDLDGFLDIFAANGGTDESQGRDARATVAQPPLLLRNNLYRGERSLENVSASLGPAFNRPIMGRGAAYADFDGDGDLDIAVGTLAGSPLLFRNDGGNRNNWLRVRTIGSKSNRSGIGASVRVTTSSGIQWQMVRSGSSYASQSELALTFGLDRAASASRIDVEWPSGAKQTFANVAANQRITIDETRGLVDSRSASFEPRPHRIRRAAVEFQQRAGHLRSR